MCRGGRGRRGIGDESKRDGAERRGGGGVGRLGKHLGEDGRLRMPTWAALKTELLTRYEALEAHLAAVHPTTPLRPSPEELRELFRSTSAG